MFEQNYIDESYPATYTYKHDINHLNIVPLDFTGKKLGYNVLKAGETARFTFKSLADKSAFVDLIYQDAGQVNKDKGTYVLFKAWNNKSKKVYDMSIANKVLLPQSQDTFTVYLAAQKSDFKIIVEASYSLFLRASLGLFALLCAVLYF